MLNLYKIIFILLLFEIISPFSFCPKSKPSPETIDKDTSKVIKPILYNGKNYAAIQVGSKIFLNDNTVNGLNYGTTGLYVDSSYCPSDFKIPKKFDFESLISELGSDAYTVLTSQTGFNMEQGKYYLTNTRGETGYNKIFMYLDGKSIKFIDAYPFSIYGVIRCMLDISNAKMIFPFDDRDVNLNEKIAVKNSISKYLNGYLWKIDDNIYKKETIEYTFTKSGKNIVEFWGVHPGGLEIYLCDEIYVNKKSISSAQTFDESKIKIIQTNFSMYYYTQLNFAHSNCPIATRTNGGYYIAITDTNKFLHVLSFDKNDNLIKDLNTTEKGYPHDITETDYGFAIYILEADSTYHSYINLYNKNFELINTVQIMNNKATDDKTVDSTLKKQIIKYDSSWTPVFGMRFMYRPDNGKLIYSRGRIFLIFAHYNHFIDNGGHTGDTVATFNDVLLDMDFGITWGASHSLIQSATYDENYFWTAALSDAYPEGIKVEYTSKKSFTSEYDPVNTKYNSRVTGSTTALAGYIKGYHTGPADGKLGGILYFEKHKLYCLVYAKTPNYSDDVEKNGISIIFITTWKFENNIISNNKTYEIKVFKTGNLMQLRAGKYGDDKIFIIYSEYSSSGNGGYGYVAKGTTPRVYVVGVPNMNIMISDKIYDKLLMNTNEDLRTFRDGVLIWGTANKEGKLVINKIGNRILDESYEDINEIITKEDVENYRNNVYNEEKKGLSGGAIAGIVFGCIFGLAILTVAIYYLIRHFKTGKAFSGGMQSNPMKKLLPKRFY